MNFEPEMTQQLFTSGNENQLAPVRDLVAMVLTDATLPIEQAKRAAELIIRLAVMHIAIPTAVLPVETDDQAREFAETYVSALVKAARTRP